MHLRAATLTFALVSLPALALDQHQQVIVERAKAMITRDFKDPSSAQWRGLYLMRGDTLCGEVNAKNSYGGYVGFRRFFAGTALGSAAVEDAPGAEFSFS